MWYESLKITKMAVEPVGSIFPLCLCSYEEYVCVITIVIQICAILTINKDLKKHTHTNISIKHKIELKNGTPEKERKRVFNNGFIQDLWSAIIFRQ